MDAISRRPKRDTFCRTTRSIDFSFLEALSIFSNQMKSALGPSNNPLYSP
jgi:hypothetical protein